MSLMRHLSTAAAATALTSAAALAEPAIIFDLGGKFDKSFNEAAYEGAERWAEETGGSYREIELTSEAQREQALRRMAESGANPVVTVGFAYASTLNQLAPEYADTDFVAIDAFVDQPNVRNYTFAEHEGSYLVGMLAAMASESDTVGFVGGMDIPLIRKLRLRAGRQGGQPRRRGRATPATRRRPGTTRRAAGSRPVPWSARARTWSTTPQGAPASASCRRRPTRESSASASIPTRTTCSRAAYSPRC